MTRKRRARTNEEHEHGRRMGAIVPISQKPPPDTPPESVKLHRGRPITNIPKFEGRGGIVEINVNNKIKVLEIWLAHDDENNAAISDLIKRKISEYKQLKYKTAVFHSGNGDLLFSAEGLIKNNL